MSLMPVTREELYLAKLGGQDVEIPDSPVTRIEKYLDVLCGSNGVVPSPVTRVEHYLAKIAGENVQISEPVTRLEKYLYAIAQSDNDVPAPITRIEHLLNEWANGGGDIPIDPTRFYAYITTANRWVEESGSYTVCVPVTVGKTYIMEFTTTASSIVGKIFRYGFSDTNTPIAQTLTQCVRSTPQDTRSATVVADNPYLVLQFGAAVAQSVIEDGYFTLRKADRTSPIVGIGQVGYMTI